MKFFCLGTNKKNKQKRRKPTKKQTAFFGNMETNVKGTTNWNNNNTDDISKTIQTTITTEDIFIRPELVDIIREDHAVLLTSKDPFVPCELNLTIFPRFKLKNLTMVCSADKVELFLGQDKEYTETIFGSIITDDGDDPEPFFSFRFDIEIEKSGVTEAMLKLIVSTGEVCVFGIALQIAPNPNGITTLLQTPTNLESIKEKQQTNTEKCKLFMEMLEKVPIQRANTVNSIKNDMDQCTKLDGMIKLHINKALDEFEFRMNERLEAFENRQTEKLNKIIRLLEERS